MSEILSAVRLKDKVLIIVLTLVMAIFVGLIAGAVTYATTDRHVHEFEYHLERGADGKFDFVGICQYEDCTNPRYSRDILSGVSQEVTLAPTCTATGVMQFSFTYEADMQTYTYTEDIPMEAHTYVGNVATDENGVSSIKGTCIFDGCDAPEIDIEGATELTLESTTVGNCYTPDTNIYSYQLDGTKYNVTVQSGANAPHKLNGKSINEYQIADGVYLYGTDGIVLVGAPALGCGNKAPGYFVCQDCGKAIPIMIGRPDHNYELASSGLTTPTVIADGQATLRCTAEGCEQVKRVTLPKAVVGDEGNSYVVERSCAIGKQVLDYTYFVEEYGVNVELQLTLPWNEHDYKYIESETKAPSLEKDGYAVIRCAAEGCSANTRVVLNKIELDDPDRKNSEVISEATERTLKQIRYTYVSETYGFTVELQIGVGTLLTHNYVYELEFVPGLEPSFDLVGKCHQKECVQPEIREQNVTVESIDTSTCQTPGALIYTHKTESGEVYTLSMPIGLSGHKVVKLDKPTLPTLSSEGSVTLSCTYEDCPHKEVVVVLPKVDFATNSTMQEDGSVLYSYYYEPLDYYIALTLIFTVDQG